MKYRVVEGPAAHGPRYALRLLAAATLWPLIAQAHMENAAEGFMSGLLHPVFGLDHFLAMLSVGIVSAQLGGLSVFTVPALFVLSMIGGAVAGIYGQQWPFTEIGIAVSVIILGLLIVVARPGVNSLPVMLVVAFFGSLHGHAHGLEMPNSADPIYYAAGFLVSTASIHLLGVGIGHWFMMKEWLGRTLRHIGSGMAGMGLMILVSLLSAA